MTACTLQDYMLGPMSFPSSLSALLDIFPTCSFCMYESMLQRTTPRVNQPNNNLLTVEAQKQLIPGWASDFNSGGRSSFRHVSRFSTSTSICRVRVSTYH